MGLLNKVRVFSPLFASLSIALFLVSAVQATLRYDVLSYQWCELVDFGFWALFVFALIAGALDLVNVWSNCPLLSTSTVTIMGLALITSGRLSSLLYSLLKVSFAIQPIGGGIVDYVSIKLALVSLIGALLIFLSTSLNTLLKKPLVLKKTITWGEVSSQFTTKLKRVPLKVVYAIAFFTGFLVRLYPEILYWPLPIGWDTLEYIANARDFAFSPKIITTYLWMGGLRNLPPLLTYITGSLSLLGVDPLYFYKLYPPVIMGFISLVSAMIAHELSKSKVIATMTALFTAFNPYIVGQSHQWHRHTLGALLLLLYILVSHRRRNSAELKATLLVLLAASYELGGVIALFTSLYEILTTRSSRSRLLFATTFAISFLLLSFYAKVPERPIVAMTPQGVYVVGGARYSAAQTLEYTLICLLLIAPSITAIPVFRGISRSVKFVIAFILLVFLLPALTTIAIVEQHRWFALLVITLAPYTVTGLRNLSSKLMAIYVLITALMGVAYVFTSGGYYYFDIWKTASLQWAHGFPWRLTPTVTNIADSAQIAKILLPEEKQVLVSSSLYPELHLFLRNPENVFATSGDPGLEQTLYFMVARNASAVYVVTSRNLTVEYTNIVAELGDFYARFKSTYDMEIPFNVEDVECAEMYRGETLNLYRVEVLKHND